MAAEASEPRKVKVNAAHTARTLIAMYFILSAPCCKLPSRALSLNVPEPMFNGLVHSRTRYKTRYTKPGRALKIACYFND
jgi:hypothetical protein